METANQRAARIMAHLVQEPLERAGEGSGAVALEPCRGVQVIPLNPATLADYLDEHRALKDRVYRIFEANPQLITPVEISKDAHRELVFRQMQALVGAGINAMELLRKNQAQYFALAEAIGQVDLSLAIKTGVQFSLWGGSVQNLGTAKHHQRWMADIETLRAPGCFAMTELDHGSNVQGVQTEGIYDPETDEIIVNTPNEGATKWWIGNAALHGIFSTVFLQLKLPRVRSAAAAAGGKAAPMVPAPSLSAPGVELVSFGVHAVVVPLRRPEDGSLCNGVEIRDCGLKVGLNGIDNGAIRYNNVRVPRENLLNRFGDVLPNGEYKSDLPAIKRFAAMLGELVGGRVGLATGSVGVLKTACTIATRYALYRQQFGPPNKAEVVIMDYQSHQQKLMPMLASCFAFHFAGRSLVDRYSLLKQTPPNANPELVADVHSLSAGLKAYITGYTANALNVCRESCGGHGYAAVNRFGQLRSDHDIFQTFEGDNTVLLQQVAADLLKKYKEQFSGGALSNSWYYLRQVMATYLTQTNPVATHRDSSEHLRDPAFLLAAFQYRTARLLHTAALRLRKQTARLGSFEGWNKCLNHLLTLANAHIETVILKEFMASVERCRDRGCRAALRTMMELYALERIWSHIGSFRNEDYVAPNKAKAIQREVEKLCAEARAIAGPLVDSFAIPDGMLRAPIGLRNNQYEAYSHSVGF